VTHRGTYSGILKLPGTGPIKIVGNVVIAAYVLTTSSAFANDDNASTSVRLPGDSCVQIQQPMDRLKCFDDAYSVIQHNKTNSGVTQRPTKDKQSLTGSQDSPLQNDAEKNFGKDQSAADSKKYISSTMVSVQHGAYGIDYFKLDNGQVWRESEDSLIDFRVGQKIRIEKGIMNSFFLRIEGIRKRIKVKRVK